MPERVLNGLRVVGAPAALFTVFVLAQGGGRLSSIRLLLIGVSLGYSLSGLTSLFLYAAPNAAAKNEILFWILGSLGAATAAAGPIGFVGLVVPHGARILVGADHPWVMPLAALLGAGYLVAVDLFGRMILAPAEIRSM